MIESVIEGDEGNRKNYKKLILFSRKGKTGLARTKKIKLQKEN